MSTKEKKLNVKKPLTNTEPEDVQDKKGRHTVTPDPPDVTDATRGSSMQGPKQAATGGPAGANQGGAPRGANRLEPSHQHDQQKKDRKKR